MTQASFEFTLRVYFEDTDAGGVVFYANYLKFFERARTEWLRRGGVEQQRFGMETGLMFAVRHTAVDYHKPARLDDLLRIVSHVEKLGGASVTFYQEAWRDGIAAAAHPDASGTSELLATGRIKVACVGWDDDHTHLRPVPIPPQVRQALAFSQTAALLHKQS